MAQVQTFETTTQIVISNLTTAWETIRIFLPVAVAQQAQVQFDNAVAAVNHALQALQDGVQAAVDAKNNAPDFSKAILDVSNAVQQIVAIVEEYKTQQVQPAGVVKATASAEPPGLADAKIGLEHMRHYQVHVR